MVAVLSVLWQLAVAFLLRFRNGIPNESVMWVMELEREKFNFRLKISDYRLIF